eukprot:gnl/Spiro4/2500_TR1205_c0_g2_i1.p2 gnl/Spiro4/2500_TR1205_c0_g2~~gnl/Spiro4/2500_TR1205_c0_g2_i1.p2  ORF type:complete len:127 (-),score=6.90 gnl/Spiro4/2500_TR1205_c0_g2_i1:3-383(-)
MNSVAQKDLVKMSNPQKKTSTELIPVSTAASSTRTAIMTALGKLVEQAIDEGVQERLDQAITLLKGSQSVTPLNGEIISPAPRKRAPRTSESMSRNAAQDHSISVRDAILELLNSKPKAMIPCTLR